MRNDCAKARRPLAEANVRRGSNQAGAIVQALGGAVVTLCVVPLTAAIWAVALGAI